MKFSRWLVDRGTSPPLYLSTSTSGNSFAAGPVQNKPRPLERARGRRDPAQQLRAVAVIQPNAFWKKPTNPPKEDVAPLLLSKLSFPTHPKCKNYPKLRARFQTRNLPRNSGRARASRIPTVSFRPGRGDVWEEMKVSYSNSFCLSRARRYLGGNLRLMFVVCFFTFTITRGGEAGEKMCEDLCWVLLSYRLHPHRQRPGAQLENA